MKRLHGKTLMVLAGVTALHTPLGLQPVWAEAEPSDAAHLNEIEPSATTVDEWATQLAQAELAEITDIQLTETPTGFTLQLETSGDLAVPETSTTGNATVADIPNATLNLPDGNEYSISNPAEGIALIDVSVLSNNQVRIAITGIDAPPRVTISVGTAGLVVSGAPGDPAAQGPDDDTIQITVTGEDEDDYFVPNASAATRTDTPVLDIPASIQVIPEQVLDDQQAVRIEDALTNVSGVAFGGSRGGFDTDFTIRGFDGVPILRDGFRQFGVFGESAPEIANLERIEVLRGPASILYGAIEPGGLINLVTKQPLAEPFYEAQLQLGNRGFISPQIDFSGPLTEDGRLRYRLNALYRNEAPFQDFDRNIERFFVAPTLSWQISDRTDLTLQLEYSDYEGPSSVGLFASGTEIADVPFDLITGEPSDFIETETVNVGYSLEHRFNENWRLRNAFRFNQQDYLSISAAPFFLNGPLLFRALGNRDSFDQNFGVQTNVVGEFSTGSVDHTLLFGVDFNRTELTDFLRVDLINLRPINIFNPVYGTFNGVDVSALPIVINQNTQTNRFGAYLQDQIDILDNLILVAGVRYDTVNQTLINRPNVFVPTATQTVRNNSAW
ncbi:MAG: TonB-dependent receptor, partial [Cyanobacteria bacterium P01_H01_bin.121]